MTYQILVDAPLPAALDYLPPAAPPGASPQRLERGRIVHVPLGRRQVAGVIAGRRAADPEAPHRLRPIANLPPVPPIPEDHLAWLEWCAAYYHHPPGEVAAAALPPFVSPAVPAVWCYFATAEGRRGGAALTRAPRQRALLARLVEGECSAGDLDHDMPNWRAVFAALEKRGFAARRPATAQSPVPLAGQGPVLRDEQRRAAAAILNSSGYGCFLLDGVTGSGKTEVYLVAAREVLRRGRQVLILVPEIGLTPQTLDRARDRLGVPIAAYHSALPAGERHRVWRDFASGTQPVVVGTRSAIFLPAAELGLIVVDEEHDASYKQQEGFLYSARDIAVVRAKRLAIPIVLGSATPALESLANAARRRYHAWHLDERPAARSLWRIVDQRATSGIPIAPETREAIGTALDAGRQVLVFRNRRGYASCLLCRQCGWVADCPACSAHFTWHRSQERLICHHCGRRQRVPMNCPQCAGSHLQALGHGTERLEETLHTLFPEHEVRRVDRDRIRSPRALTAVYERLRSGGPCIWVGTQMLAKGHDFPALSLVVVTGIDSALLSSDFHAPERLAQLIEQVAGRAGRREEPGTILLQTRQPEHPLLTGLIHGGYRHVAAQLLAERRAANLPPYTAHAVLRAECSDGKKAEHFLQAAARLAAAQNKAASRIVCRGPFPALLERRAGRWRWQLWLQAAHRTALGGFLDHWLPAVRELKPPRSLRWYLDVDPLEL